MLFRSDSDEYAYWVKNVMPYVKDQMGNIRTARIKPLSYNWDNSEAPKKYVKFTTIRLKSEDGNDWFDYMRRDAKLKRDNGFTGIRGVFWVVSGSGWEIHVVEPYDSHGTRLGTFGNDSFDYEDKYNEMFGWRSLEYDRRKANEAIREYSGDLVETLEFRPEMSTSME